MSLKDCECYDCNDCAVAKKWEALKEAIRKHPNVSHYMGKSTLISIYKIMEELEKEE